MFNLFRPAPPRTITVSPAGRQFSARKGGVLLEEALLAGVPLPHNCTVGTCGACKCRLTEGKIVELTDFALSPLTGEELRAGYILACQSSVRTDVVIEVDLGSQADFAKVSGRVAGQTRLTSDIMGLRIVLDEPMSYRPGQYAHVGLEGVPVARSFSFATPCRPQVGQEVEFMIRLAPGGQFTEALFARDFTGEKATVEGPLGGFGLSEDEAPMLCVAGGDGPGADPGRAAARARQRSDARRAFLPGGAVPGGSVRAGADPGPGRALARELAVRADPVGRGRG